MGGGGSEYWKKPIFIKVENGEIEDFAKKLLKILKLIKTVGLKILKKIDYSSLIIILKNQKKSL